MKRTFAHLPLRKAAAIAGVVAAMLCGRSRALAAEEGAPGVEADLESRIFASSNLAAGRSGVSQWSSSIDLSAPVAGSDAFGLGVDVVAERLGFGFQNFGGFIPGKASPLSGASVLSLQPTLALTPSTRWSLIESAQVQYAGAGDARLRDAALWAGSSAVACQYDVGLKIGFGIEVEQRMRASALILPFPIIDWRISDRWSLVSLDGESGRLACSITKFLGVYGQLEFQSQDLRLGRLSSLPSGILRYEAYPLTVGIQWKPGPHTTASVYGGEAISQSYRFESARGDLLGLGATHAPILGGFEIDCSF